MATNASTEGQQLPSEAVLAQLRGFEPHAKLHTFMGRMGADMAACQIIDYVQARGAFRAAPGSFYDVMGHPLLVIDAHGHLMAVELNLNVSPTGSQ